MRKHLILPFGFLVFLLVLVGLTMFLPVGATTIIGSVKFTPDLVDLSMSAPAYVDGAIRFPSNSSYTVKDINASTILLEGSLPPSATSFIPGALVASFDGEMTLGIISLKIYHMGGGLTPSRKVWLTVTGNLKDSLGAVPFSATGYIKVSDHHTPSPP